MFYKDSIYMLHWIWRESYIFGPIWCNYNKGLATSLFCTNRSVPAHLTFLSYLNPFTLRTKPLIQLSLLLCSLIIIFPLSTLLHITVKHATLAHTVILWYTLQTRLKILNILIKLVLFALCTSLYLTECMQIVELSQLDLPQ